MYRIYRKILGSFQGDFEFCEKVVHFRQILPLISWSLTDDEGGITCMPILDDIYHTIQDLSGSDFNKLCMFPVLDRQALFR